ncbi:hypothetical protein [Sorangium sp. So ce1151]|uniref:hypothetical protein n=1 Tax=Sorangium sp. So ce1151 TaxID=3133332 RepID=UPI003F5F40C2
MSVALESEAIWPIRHREHRFWCKGYMCEQRRDFARLFRAEGVHRRKVRSAGRQATQEVADLRVAAGQHDAGRHLTENVIWGEGNLRMSQDMLGVEELVYASCEVCLSWSSLLAVSEAVEFQIGDPPKGRCDGCQLDRKTMSERPALASVE